MMDGWQRLANAIVEQAAADYRQLLHDEHHHASVSEARLRADRKSLENFFYGDFIKLLTKVEGSAIIERLDAEGRACDYVYKKTQLKRVTI